MDIKTLEAFSLSDAVKFHDELNPKLWRNDELRPDVKKQLLIIAQDFMQELGLDDLKVEDITISGSNAAYTYTDHSDLDLHILVDFSKLPNNEVYQELFNAKKTLYNDNHDITVHGVPIELYVQDTNQVHHSLGEYSLKNNTWTRIPKKRKADLDQSATKLKYDKLYELIHLALKSKNIEKINELLSTIKRYRQAGLDQGGEFSPENLAFKALRSQGLINKLYALKNKLHSDELTIETVNETNSGYKEIEFVCANPEYPDATDEKLQRKMFIELKKLPGVIPLLQDHSDMSSGQKSLTAIYKDKNIKQFILKLAKELGINVDIIRPVSDNYVDRAIRGEHEGQVTSEDYDPNGPPPGPEFPPTMPAGTVRVDVSDVYDWYKLGQHISNMKGLGKHDFGKGPPSTILSFGDEDLEHEYIKALQRTGLSTTDIDPVDPHQPKGMKRQKVDPTYNVNESDDIKDVAHWMDTTPDKLKVEIKQEPIEKFIKQIREMYGTFDENPEDEERTNRILKLLKRGAEPLPIYVEADDKDLFVMEGRHRMVAFWLSGMKTIPVAYVSTVVNESSFNKCFNKACEVYDKALKKNLKPVMYQVADYVGDAENADSKWQELPKHVWSHYVTVVNDIVLDPTAKQFGDEKPTKYSFDELQNNWKKIFKIRPKEIDEAGYKGNLGISELTKLFIKHPELKPKFLEVKEKHGIEKAFMWAAEQLGVKLQPIISKEQGVAEDTVNLPSVLYHATYKPRLKSINLKGLGGGGKRNWEDSKPGVVYLALDPSVAESYAETSDIVPEEWLDNIVILKISTAGLDPNKFHIDSNVQDNAGDTIEYHGVIPVSNISVYKQGVAEGVPQPGPSSGAPKQFGADAKIQTRQMTVKDIISSVPGVPYYNNVVDDWDAKDYSWGVTKKVIEYATYLKDHPETITQLPPIIVLNGKFEDGAHRVSAIWLLQQRMDPKNPLWKNTKLNVQFVKQDVAEGLGNNEISFKVQKGKNKFATTLSINNKPAGVYQYDATTGRSIAEVYPEFKGKGFGKILVLHAIYTAAKLGLDFVEDESRTAEYDNVLDSLSSNGYIVDDDGYWYVTNDGEQYLNQSLKQGVAESASGYIPSKKQANDPRFKTALTVDVKPDTIKKNAKAFGFKVSRAGIPPLLREGQLSALVSQDQNERNEYKKFVQDQANGDYKKGAELYAKFKKRSINDLFNDRERLIKFMNMKFDFNKFSENDWKDYWLLAQHCDFDRNFQKQALRNIRKYQGTDNENYQYLYDRISCGLNGTQKYSTQNVCNKDSDIIPLLREGLLNETGYEEAAELLGQPIPEIQKFVQSQNWPSPIDWNNPEHDKFARRLGSIIDAAPDTQIPAASIPKLKNLASKNDEPILKAVTQISGRPDAEEQYVKLMQTRDKGENRNRGYSVNDLIKSVKTGTYDSPVLLKLPEGVFVIGGRTRLYAALALNIPAKVKIISAETFNGSKVTEGKNTGKITAYHGTRRDIDEFESFSHFGTFRAAYDRLDHTRQGNTDEIEQERIYQVELNITNPIKLDVDIYDNHKLSNWMDLLQRIKVLNNSETRNIKSLDDLSKLLLDKGYDGIKYKNRWEHSNSTSYVIFKPEQVKITDIVTHNQPNKFRRLLTKN